MQNLTKQQLEELVDIRTKIGVEASRLRLLHNEDDAPITDPLWQASDLVRKGLDKIDSYLRPGAEVKSSKVTVIDGGTF